MLIQKTNFKTKKYFESRVVVLIVESIHYSQFNNILSVCYGDVVKGQRKFFEKFRIEVFSSWIRPWNKKITQRYFLNFIWAIVEKCKFGWNKVEKYLKFWRISFFNVIFIYCEIKNINKYKYYFTYEKFLPTFLSTLINWKVLVLNTDIFNLINLYFSMSIWNKPQCHNILKDRLGRNH